MLLVETQNFASLFFLLDNEDGGLLFGDMKEPRRGSMCLTAGTRRKEGTCRKKNIFSHTHHHTFVRTRPWKGRT